MYLKKKTDLVKLSYIFLLQCAVKICKISIELNLQYRITEKGII